MTENVEDRLFYQGQASELASSRYLEVDLDVMGGGTGLPGYGKIPQQEKVKTTRHHYRWEIYALNRDELRSDLPAWRANAEANRPAWEGGRTIGDLQRERGRFGNRVCSVCASGPSLAYELPDIVTLRGQVTVIAIDSAVQPLKLLGVIPDFVFVRNADALTLDLLRRFPSEKCAFVLPVHAHPELVRAIRGPIYFYVPIDEQPELVAWADGFPGIPRLTLKQSTAAMAFLFARSLDFHRYALEGFDFAYSYGKYYCDAVRYLDQPDLVGQMQNPTDPKMMPFQMTDIFSEPTYTNFRMHMNAEDLFRTIRFESMDNVYNASLGILYNLNWLPLKYVVSIPEQSAKTPDGQDIWKVVEHYFPTKANTRETNERTGNAFLALSSRNIIVNHEAGLVKHKLGEWFDRSDEFRGRIAVVAGAGPSLDDNLEAMRRHRDRYFLMAVDAALNPLLEAGLRPDAVINIDPERRVGMFFEGVDTAGLNLIAGLTLHPEVARMWKGDIYWSFTITPVRHLVQLMGLYEQVSLLIPYGNCGSTGIVLCWKLGFEKVVLTGVDFAFTHDRYYARNVLVERHNRPESKAELEALLAGKRNGCLQKVDVRGNTVWTDEIMNMYAETLVESLKSNPATADVAVNAGAGLTHGIPVVDFDAFFRGRG